MPKIPKEIVSGTVIISGYEIPCAVLDDERRILRERSVARALGKKGSGAHWKKKRETKKGALLPEYISTKNLEQFIDDELRETLLNPITYITKSGNKAQGIDATVLPKVCNIWLKAREKGALYKSQINTAKKAEILLRGFAHVGIIALIDAATGFQEIRSRQALEEILEQFISQELQKWAKTFPDDFYKEMFRLRGWQYIPLSVKRPSVVGHLTNDIVYKRLAPGVLNELRRLTPKDEKGHRKHRYFQRLTQDIGHPRLREHLTAVIALMKASSRWGQFYRSLQRALPKYNVTLDLPLNLEEDENKNN